jgi:hypothetical protein
MVKKGLAGFLTVLLVSGQICDNSFVYQSNNAHAFCTKVITHRLFVVA